MTGSAVPWIAWVAGALYDDCMFSLWQSVVPLSILLKTRTGFAEVKLLNAPDAGAVQLYVNVDEDEFVTKVAVGLAHVVV